MTWNHTGTARTYGNDAEWLSVAAGEKVIGYVEAVMTSKAGNDYSEVRNVVKLAGNGKIESRYPRALVNGFLAPLKGEDVGSIFVVEASATKKRQGKNGREWPVTRCYVINRNDDGFDSAATDLAALSGDDDDLPF